MSNYYIYRYTDSYCNELIEGFALLTEYQKDILLARLKKEFRKGSSFFVFDDERSCEFSELMEIISFDPISKSEYETMKKLFPVGSHGILGPVETDDIEDDDDDADDEESDDSAEYCDECSSELSHGEVHICEDCNREKELEAEYLSEVECLVKFIKQQYHLEPTISNGETKFIWKPTPITEINIIIEGYESGEIELILKKGSKEVEREYLTVNEVSDSPEIDFKPTLQLLIDKARKI